MKKISLLVLMLSMIWVSCDRDSITDEQLQEIESRTNIESTDVLISKDKIILGEKLENPYSVKNMKYAFSQIEDYEEITGKSLNENQLDLSTFIKATHLYVRFLPKDKEELEYLEVDKELILFNFPLDYEVSEGSEEEYFDTSLPEGSITWKYTKVPVDYDFTDIKYEIIEELFLLDEDLDEEEEDIQAKNYPNNYRELYEQLEDISLRLTNNIVDNNSIEPKFWKRKSKWWVKGKIQYEDIVDGENSSTMRAVEGAKVIVKRWFKWKSGITDSNGEFNIGSFRGDKVKCAIKWERDDWDIRTGSYGQAWYNFETVYKRDMNDGKKWNINVKRASTPRNWFYANIHRGAMEYFYNHSKYGIKKPYSKRGYKSAIQIGSVFSIFRFAFGRKLHIGAKYKEGRSHYYAHNKIVWSSPVAVYSHSKLNGALDSREVFGTTIHELAHVSHWDRGYSTTQYVFDWIGTGFDGVFLPESWATGVENHIVESVYPKSSYISTYNYDYNQRQTIDDIQNSQGYTGIVTDMIDTDNQRKVKKGDSRYPNDEVEGYTLQQLEDALPNEFGSWKNWMERIKEKYNNPTENKLDYLFNTYKP